MSNYKYENLSNEELSIEFAKWAKIESSATLDGPAARRAAYRLKAMSEIFQARGLPARSLLLQLLDDADEGIRYQAAHLLLAIAPARARAVIERVAAGIGPIAADARGAIEMLDSGEYKPK